MTVFDNLSLDRSLPQSGIQTHDQTHDQRDQNHIETYWKTSGGTLRLLLQWVSPVDTLTEVATVIQVSLV